MCCFVCLYAFDDHEYSGKRFYDHRDSVSAGTITCFAVQFVTCPCAPGLDALGESKLDILDSSPSMPNIGTWAEFTPSILLSTGKIKFLQRSK